MQRCLLVPLLCVLTLLGACRQSSRTLIEPQPFPTNPFFEDLQKRTFLFFWETTNPRNGLVPDRWPTPSFSSVAAVGFGLSAYLVGVERGYISRAQARERTLTTLRFFWRAPQGPAPTGVTGYRGFFYHFLDMETGVRFRDVELSTIDTCLLLAGVLSAAEYFDQSHPEEQEIRELADSLYRRVEWNWMQLPSGHVSMGWKPDQGRFTFGYEGYDEAMILYLLALGSPTHPVEARAWSAFTSTYRWGDYYGQQHVNFAPLFGHQYSHIWVDFKGIQDDYMRGKGIDYFENSRRATLAQKAYAQANPNGWRDYGGDLWGLTASDGPKDTTTVVDGKVRRFFTYRARGAAATEVVDDGTLVPTAAGGSIPFAPEITIPSLNAMHEKYGEHLYQKYGFLDAFNPTYNQPEMGSHTGTIVPGVGWFDRDYLGIDQGPIVLMMENYRSGMIWKLMRDNPYLLRGLCRAGFTGGWIEGKC